MKHFKTYKWAYGFLIISLTLAAVFGPKLTSVVVKSDSTEKLQEVKHGDVIQKVLISGVITPKRTTSIVAPYDGYIRKLFVNVGDLVKEGQPLVTISQLAHSRNEELYPILAPFAGKIVQVLKTEGEFAEKAASSPGRNMILRLDDLSSIYIAADAPEIDHGKLKLGQSVVIRASALPKKTYKGKIDQISMAPKYTDNWERGRVEYPIRIQVIDPDNELISGMSAMAEVITKEVKGVLVISHESLIRDKGKYFVDTGVESRKEVIVGLENEEFVEISSGITEGTKVRAVDFLKM